MPSARGLSSPPSQADYYALFFIKGHHIGMIPRPPRRLRPSIPNIPNEFLNPTDPCGILIPPLCLPTSLWLTPLHPYPPPPPNNTFYDNLYIRRSYRKPPSIKLSLFPLLLFTISISTQSSQIDILVSLRLLNPKNIPWEENDAKDHRRSLFHTRAG